MEPQGEGGRESGRTPQGARLSTAEPTPGPPEASGSAAAEAPAKRWKGRRAGRAGDPLEPIEVAVTALFGVLLGLLIVAVVASLLFDDIRISVVAETVCVTDSVTSGGTSALDGAFGARPGVEVIVDGPRYCLPEPTAGQRALDATGTLVSMAWRWGALLLALLLVRRARRTGPFTDGTVRGLHVLGWHLSAGAVAAHLVGGLTDGLLLRDMVDHWAFGGLLDLTALPWLAVLTGLGLITFSRLMRLATAMREDLEGVV